MCQVKQIIKNLTHHVNKNLITTPGGEHFTQTTPGQNDMSIPIQKENNEFEQNEKRLEKKLKDAKDAIFVRKYLT